MAKPDTSNIADASAKRRLPRNPRSRAAAARAPRSSEDVVSALPDMAVPDDVILNAPPRERAAGLPERKYSFNALIAVGITGFLVGRLLSR
ncbi:hypothetical protein [Ancylobacter defluvii]|uniref:Uncharacterized protein n=1 Tax=Ancylobacter defluvii TaxID=1282440 RepID=A0A9W6JVF4_9HYPH|nr:hypothetical protein [Ancylobacter defluvii]MBS7587769.1 hypothetical protein [Ancylobacter defluvii]GLK82579.1 hypothetical protein GCM10017653_06480 [Ancylobacter defluvii]